MDLAPFRWLDHPENALDEIFCVSFFRGLTPTDVVRRFARSDEPGEEVAFAELWDIGGEPALEAEGGHIGVVQANGWSVAVELGGWTAVLTDYAADLSRGCEMVAVSRHDYAQDGFVYAVDGELITGFVPPLPFTGWGSDLHRLDRAMRSLGIPTEPMGDEWEIAFERLHPDKLPRTFALAAEVTGVSFTRDFLDFPFLAGPVTPR
ncbi:hypothetical protein BJF79_07980 [Actinomadura sp. CNU-125]|uniref:DUF6461 domain-containing protein n=1 Tax=Actinomadura sp. CNU-125 TaxID=1904961 RepID=UPI000959A228|nr:DUF6461 domain-containing protein [Actinomadura sp. CNU-125]OLT33210.1 hypothetical protein BJF79_07980 [Actinomadura sp. CNU-125]